MGKRIKSIDSLRSLAILAVILIHTTTRTLEASRFDIVGFSWTLFLNQISRFAVPLFFLISGFVLEISAREESYFSFLKRRFAKVVIPYAFWSLIYYYFIYTGNGENIFKALLKGSASYQLYFIPTLCIFYLLFPFVHKLRKIFMSPFVLVGLGGLQIYLLWKDYFIKQFMYPDPIHIAILAFFFFMAGIAGAMYKDKIDGFIRRFKIVLIPLAILSGIYIYWEGRNGYLNTGNYLSYYSNWRPSTFVYTLLIFFSFYYIFEYTKVGKSFISRFAKHSFFAFFVHVAILEIVWKYVGGNLFAITSNAIGKIIFDPIFFVTIATTSFAFAKVLHKIPKLARLTG